MNRTPRVFCELSGFSLLVFARFGEKMQIFEKKNALTLVCSKKKSYLCMCFVRKFMLNDIINQPYFY